MSGDVKVTVMFCVIAKVILKSFLSLSFFPKHKLNNCWTENRFSQLRWISLTQTVTGIYRISCSPSNLLNRRPNVQITKMAEFV